jgi:mRNA interferase MazF
MPFHQAAGAKVRPAVVVLDTGDEDFVAAPITSHARAGVYESTIQSWKEAGLNAASFVRVYKLTVLAKSDILRTLGHLQQQDRESITAVLCHGFCRTAQGSL